MKRFVCYTLEGLLRQDRHEVWVVLGTFASAEQADSAARAATTRSGISQTRVMPYYRTIELPVARDASLPRRPHLAGTHAAADQAVTVA
jgi:hypothetical protein